MTNYTDDVWTTKKFITGESGKSNGEIDFHSAARTSIAGVHNWFSIINDNDILKFLAVNQHSLPTSGASSRSIMEVDSEKNSITVGGNGVAGKVIVKDSTNQDKVTIDGNTGNLTVGKTQLVNQNSLLMYGGPLNKYTVTLDAENSVMNFARPSDGKYKVTINGAASSLLMFGGPLNKNTIALDAENSVMNFARPSDGKYTVKIDGISGDVILQNADCAEDFETSLNERVDPGTVMAINDDGKLVQSEKQYDKRVAGVISGAGDLKPGLILGRQPGNKNRVPLALAGRVYCKVDADYDRVEVGDLLTTSETPGYAMKASDPIRSFGAVIGKALRPMKYGQGLIPILVSLQ